MLFHAFLLYLQFIHSVTMFTINQFKESPMNTKESPMNTKESLMNTKTTEKPKVGDIHLFNMTPITGRGKPYDFLDLEKPKMLKSKPIDITKHAYVVSILRYGQMVGVGSLMSELWVLTTAYNAVYGENVRLQVRAGSNSPYIFGELRNVIKREVYYLYNYTWTHNIALLRLDGRIRPARNIRYAQLGLYLPLRHQELTIVGWGTNGRHWQTLLEERGMYYTEHSICIEHFHDAEDMTHSVFCVPDTRRGPCYYNFGAPLIDQNYDVVGMYLGTHKCNSENGYGAYIDVTCYKRWIEKNIRLREGEISGALYSLESDKRKLLKEYRKKEKIQQYLYEESVLRGASTSDNDYYEDSQDYPHGYKEKAKQIYLKDKGAKARVIEGIVQTTQRPLK